ncbi:MAG: hypothetical protein JWM53_5238 [bacterium]|nr:hypothetical protein [bacterium]
MRLRVVIVVVSVAVAVHALIFVALGRVAEGKGPLIPSIAPATATAPVKPSNAVLPASPPVIPATSHPPESIETAPSAQSRKPVKHVRRSAAIAAPPAAREPVFDLNAESATTTDAP